MAAHIPIIDAARCSGCGRCIAACHLQLFAFETHGWRKTSVLHESSRCNSCAKCAGICPIEAISMGKKAIKDAVLAPMVYEPDAGTELINLDSLVTSSVTNN